MHVRVGRMRHRLVLQRKVESRSATGAVNHTWTTDSTVWGAIEPLSGREYEAAAVTQNETDVRIIIRYHATIAASWRVTHGGKAYSIKSIINHDQKNDMMTLMCSQGVAEQE